MPLRIPKVWQDEIAAGTPFGILAAAAVRNLRQPVSDAVVSIAATLPSTVAPVSLSNNLRRAIELASDQRITCGTCLKYLWSLDTHTEHNAEEIISTLSIELSLPPHIREKYNTRQKRQEWLRPIVVDVLLGWVQIE